MALARLWEDDIPLKPTDVLRIKGILEDPLYALNVVTFGLPAELTRDTPRELKSALGGLAYLAYGVSRLPDIRPFAISLRGEGLQFDGGALAVYIGNGTYAGGGFPVCPDAIVDDGLLDVLIVPEMDAGNLLALATDTTLRGDPRLHEFVEHYRVPKVDVRCASDVRVNADGEPFPGGMWSFDVLPSALQLYRPELEEPDQP